MLSLCNLRKIIMKEDFERFGIPAENIEAAKNAPRNTIENMSITQTDYVIH